MLWNTWNRIKTIINKNSLIIQTAFFRFPLCQLKWIVTMVIIMLLSKRISILVMSFYDNVGIWLFQNNIMNCKVLMIIIKSNYTSANLRNRVAIPIPNIGSLAINTCVYIMDRIWVMWKPYGHIFESSNIKSYTSIFRHLAFVHKKYG